MIIDQIKKYDIVLASKSPRRQELLRNMGIDFTVMSLDVKEDIPEGSSPAEAASLLSLHKAQSIPASLMKQGTVFITADTVVALDRLILGKPPDRADALRMLSILSGREHEVVTAVSFRHLDVFHTFHASSLVKFAALTDAEIAHYVDTCEPYDKAGSYGIQEWIGFIGIEHLEGSYFNVMGLPTQRLYEELGRFLGIIEREIIPN